MERKASVLTRMRSCPLAGWVTLESNEQGHGLIRLRAGNVRLSDLIAHHAGNEVDGVAVEQCN